MLMQDDNNTGGIIRLSGHLLCGDAAEAASVRAHLPEHVRLTRVEPGCLSFQINPTPDPLVWRVDETFVDRAAFEAHQARTRASDWWQATSAIKREFEITGG